MADRFQGLLSNPLFMGGLGILSSGNIGAGLSSGLSTADMNRRRFEEEEKQKQAEALRNQYLSAFQGGLGESPDINAVASSLMGTGSPEMAIQGAKLAAGAMPAQAAPKFFAPIPVRGPDGKVRMIQASNIPGQEAQFLGDYVPFRESKVIQTPTETIIKDAITGETQETIEKDFFTPEQQKLEGRVQTQKRLDAPGKIMNVDSALETIDEMMAIPGLEGFVGAGAEMGALLARAGTDRRDFQELKQSIIDQVLMIEFDKLRGTGPITEQEAERAQRAATALNVNMSDARFVREVNRLKRRLNRLRDAYQQDLGVSRETVDEVPAEPERLSDEDLLKKYGIE